MRVVHANHRSPAFTLVELLVVLAIIAVLAALSFTGYVAIFGRQYERNTNANIEHLYGVLKKHWNHVIAEAKKESVPDLVKKMAAPDPAGERAKVMWIMLRLAEAFPQSYDEIQRYGNPAFSPIVSVGAQQKYSVMYRTKIGTRTSDPKKLQAESAACLYLALSTAKGGHALNLDQLPIKPHDTDNDGMIEFCDAWQQPIAFFRFPYANAKLASKAPTLTGPKGTYFNPLDPLKTLQDGNWPVGNKTTFENEVRFEIGVGDRYTTPVLVSAGNDNLLGLELKNSTRGFADMFIFPILPSPPGDRDSNNIVDAKDNLYSFDIVAP